MLDKCVSLVNKALELGASDSEACILERRGLECTLEKNSPRLVSAQESVGMATRVIKDHRLGFSFSTNLEDVELPAKKALEVSRLGKEMKDFSFPSIKSGGVVKDVFDKRLASLPQDYGLEALEEIVRGALDVDEEMNVTKGRVRYGVETLSIANSTGLEAEDRVTYLTAEVGAVLKRKGVSTGSESYCSKLMDADFFEVGKRSAQWAADTSNPKKTEGGRMSVILHPLALRDMLEFILAPALYADRARKGESAYSDKLGEIVASEKVSIFDDPTVPNAPNSGKMDDEGTPSSKTDLITNGKLEGYLYDCATASEYQENSTGNAMRVGRLTNDRQFKEPPRISARNLVLEGPGKAFDDLISETSDGIYVHSVLGAHTSNPASGDFSVNSPRLLKVENGDLSYPVTSVMISGNLPSLLLKLSGVGDDRRTMKGAIRGLAVIAPSVRFDDVQVT